MASVLFTSIFLSVIYLIVFAKLNNNEATISNAREYVEIDGKTYYFGLVNVKWIEADSICKNMSMQLLTLDTRNKSDFWNNWLYENQNYNYWMWIGGRRESNTTIYYWTTTNQPFMQNETDWSPSEPNTNITSGACVNFRGWPDAWEDDYCDIFNFTFICEEIPLA